MSFLASMKRMIGVASDTKSVPLNDPLALQIFGSEAETIAGPAIGPASAMRVPAVASAVNLIASATGTLPAKLFFSGTGGKRVAEGHPAYSLIHDEANEWTSASGLREALTIDALLYGSGYAYANRVEGRVVEFLRLDPTSVSVEQDAATGEPYYVTGSGSGQKRYGYRDILHISAPGGASPIALAREAIGLALTLERHAGRLFGRGARPSGVLRFPKTLGEDAVKRISWGWHMAHGGDASGRTAILEEGGEFQSLTFNSVDAQFEEMRRFQIEEIARAFRVPPHLLFELSRATWSNAEEMARTFLTLTLRPWLDAWEWAYARVLLTPEERKTHYVEFITNDLLSADTATRAAAYAQFRSMGVMTANEVRAAENLPPLPGGDVLQNPYTTTGSPTPDNDNSIAERDAA